jgi:hypothetical protein
MVEEEVTVKSKGWSWSPSPENPRGLLVYVVLLAAVGGGIWWSNKKEASKKPADTTVKMLTIPDGDFQEIHEKKLTGEVLDLKRESGKWRIVEPAPLAADQDAVGSMVSTLSNLNADKVVEDNAADLKPYGLDTPTLDIVVTKTDGKTAELLVGDDVPTGSGAYAKLPNDPRVFSIGSSVKSGLDKKSDDLRDKRLLTFDSDKLTRVELQAKGQTVELGKNSSNEWQILKPQPQRADSSAVENLVSKLKDAKMDLANPDADAAKNFAAAPRVAIATVSDSAGTQTLEVHKTKDNTYYAKSSAVPGFYKVPSDVGDALDKGRDDFRNKKLFDFGFSDPNRIEIKGVTYTKSGDKWMSGSKTMDNTSVQNLIDKLRDLSASKFVDAAGGEPHILITVASNGDKRVEKVTIRKQGDNYFAQRENEPSIYELDVKSVADIQQAAGDVKEATPEASAKKK